MSLERLPKRLDTLTIASGASLSTISRDLRAETVVGIELTGWTAAAITFATSSNPDAELADLAPHCDADGEVEIADPSGINSGTVTIALDPARFANVRRIAVRSGTSGAPVNQAQTIHLVTRAVQ